MSEWLYKTPAAIHGRLDDAGLSAEEFRVNAHICRRCGDEGNGRQCDSKIETIAQVCRLHPDTVRKALRKLVELGWVTVDERPGKTKVHMARFPDPSGLNGGVEDKGRAAVSVDGFRLEGDPPPVLNGGDPSGLKGTKGNPEREPMKGTHKDGALPFPSPEFQEAWNQWKQHRKEKRHPITPLAGSMQLKKLEAMGEAPAIEAIRHSIANGYQGIFPPKADQTQSHSRKPLPALDLGGRRPAAILSFDDGPPLQSVAAEIVALYPRREKTTEAEEIVHRELSEGIEPDTIRIGTLAFAAVISRLPGGHLNKFVPSAEAFFRNQRWRDDPQTLLRQHTDANGAPPSAPQLNGRKPARVIKIP